MDRFMGGSDFDLSLADILGFENESDLFNRQPKVSILLLTAVRVLALLRLRMNQQQAPIMEAFVNVVMADRLAAPNDA